MHQIRPSLLTAASLLLVLLGSLPQPTCAHPFPKDDLHEAGYGYLMARQCDQYCGYNNMYCCSAGSQCYTSNGIAGCSDPAGGGVAWYTTTWTETETFTSTISSIVPAATGPGGAACIPEEGTGQIACGSICCASWQYCAYKGQCYANGPVDGGGGDMQTTTITSNGHVITTQFSPAQRVTGTPTATETSTSSVTGTQAGATGTGTGNGTVSAGGTSKKLSGGAIAGIVIGTIAGVMLLLLLCACCVMRGLWHGLLAILGLGPKKKKHRSSRETVIEEERYSRYGSPHSRRNTHGGWFGGGGGRPSSAASRKEKKKSDGVGLLGIGAAIGTLLLLLGLRRDKKRKATRARSEVSSGYYTDSYTTTNPSSASSRPTRVSRHSRGSRGTRVSRAPPHSRRESRAGSRRS